MYASQMGMGVLSICAVLNPAQGLVEGDGPDHLQHISAGASIGESSERVLGIIIRKIIEQYRKPAPPPD